MLTTGATPAGSERLLRLGLAVAALLAASLGAWSASAKMVPEWAGDTNIVGFLLIDEDTVDNGLPAIQWLAQSHGCGGGRPDACVNDNIAAEGLRSALFEQGGSILPHSGLTLPTGTSGDAGLFWFAFPDPQTNRQNTNVWTVAELIANAGEAALQHNLDKVDGIAPLRAADIAGLRGHTVCALVYDSDIGVDVKDDYGVLKGATLGVTALRVTEVLPAEGERLPSIVVELLEDPQAVCAAVGESLDREAPRITLDFPPPDHVTSQSQLTLRGKVSEAGSLTIGGAAVSVGDDLGFSHAEQLREGANDFLLVATDPAGNGSTRSVTVTLDTLPPPAPAAGQITIGQPQRLEVMVQGAAGAVEPGARVRITNSRTGESVTVTADAQGAFTAAIAAGIDDVLQIDAVDAAGNASAAVAKTVTLDRAEVDRMLRALWGGFTAALLRGDNEIALQHMTEGSRETYGQVFEVLRPRTADVLSELTQIEPIAVSASIADYAVLSVHGGKARVFIVNFVQGPDGIWRIDSL